MIWRLWSLQPLIRWKEHDGFHIGILHGPHRYSSHSIGGSSSGHRNERQERLEGSLKAHLRRGGSGFGDHIAVSVAFRIWRKIDPLLPGLGRVWTVKSEQTSPPTSVLITSAITDLTVNLRIRTHTSRNDSDKKHANAAHALYKWGTHQFPCLLFFLHFWSELSTCSEV